MEGDEESNILMNIINFSHPSLMQYLVKCFHIDYLRSNWAIFVERNLVKNYVVVIPFFHVGTLILIIKDSRNSVNSF